MIVLDASAAVEWLLHTPAGARVGHRLVRPGESLHAPHLLDVEVTQALRRLLQLKHVTVSEATDALEGLRVLALRRYSHEPLLERVWQVRASLSAYDAVYVALAEALNAPLVTCDEKLAASHGHSASIELV